MFFEGMDGLIADGVNIEHVVFSRVLLGLFI